MLRMSWKAASGHAPHTSTHYCWRCIVLATTEMGGVICLGQAGVCGLLGEEERGSSSSSRNQDLSSFLVCITEEDEGSSDGGKGGEDDRGLGVLAVEVSTGDVLYGECRCAPHCTKCLTFVARY